MESIPVPLNQPAKLGNSLPVPSNGHGVFAVSSSTHIAAPPLRCLELNVDTAGYLQWNAWCPRAKVEKAPSSDTLAAIADPEVRRLAEKPSHMYLGAPLEFELVMKVGEAPMKAQLECCLLEKFEHGGRVGYRVGWKMRSPWWYPLSSERVQVFLEAENWSGTEYYNWETFGGLLGYVVRYIVGAPLEDGTQRWMDSLKRAAE